MTCVKYNGCSVVDYACASRNTFHNIKTMSVDPLSYLSDHRPISVAFQVDCLQSLIQLENIPNFEAAPRSFKWKSGDSDPGKSFESCQREDDTADDIRQLASNIPTNSDQVYLLNRNTTALFNEISKKSLTTPKPCKRTNRKKWFDWECRSAKKVMNKACTALNSDPADEQKRALYHQLPQKF